MYRSAHKQIHEDVFIGERENHFVTALELKELGRGA